MLVIGIAKLRKIIKRGIDMAKKCKEKGEMDVIKVEILVSSNEGKELAELLTRIGEDKLSKYQACKLVNCSRATFDNLVKDGKIPKGKKQIGFKELYWNKSEILECIKQRN